MNRFTNENLLNVLGWHGIGIYIYGCLESRNLEMAIYVLQSAQNYTVVIFYDKPQKLIFNVAD
jgi:hypothetical protein